MHAAAQPSINYRSRSRIRTNCLLRFFIMFTRSQTGLFAWSQLLHDLSRYLNLYRRDKHGCHLLVYSQTTFRQQSKVFGAAAASVPVPESWHHVVGVLRVFLKSGVLCNFLSAIQGIDALELPGKFVRTSKERQNLHVLLHLLLSLDAERKKRFGSFLFVPKLLCNFLATHQDTFLLYI